MSAIVYLYSSTLRAAIQSITFAVWRKAEGWFQLGNALCQRNGIEARRCARLKLDWHLCIPRAALTHKPKRGVVIARTIWQIIGLSSRRWNQRYLLSQNRD